MGNEFAYSGPFLGSLVSITLGEFLMGLFSIIILGFLGIQFSKKYREKFSNINRYILLLFPIISVSSSFILIALFISESYWVSLIAIIPISMGLIALKYFSYNLIDKILYYIFFIFGSFYAGFIFLASNDSGSSGMGPGIALIFFTFIFYISFLIWFFVKLLIKFRADLKLKNFFINFKQKTLPQKTGIIFAGILFLLNLFLVWGLSTCKDIGCLYPGLLSFLTGMGLLGGTVNYFIFNVTANSTLGVSVLFITSLILIPIYYFIGKFLGWILSKFFKLLRK